ncbi:hypothetical protein INR49_026271 [Caranx melampygus]|nr:hypothetical protein INR49_026271 [Caranx melampygus]
MRLKGLTSALRQDQESVAELTFLSSRCAEILLHEIANKEKTPSLPPSSTRRNVIISSSPHHVLPVDTLLSFLDDLQQISGLFFPFLIVPVPAQPL